MTSKQTKKLVAKIDKADKINDAIIEALQFAKEHNYSDYDTAITIKGRLKTAGFHIVHKRK